MAQNITYVPSMEYLEARAFANPGVGDGIVRTGFGWELVLPGVTYRLRVAAVAS